MATTEDEETGVPEFVDIDRVRSCSSRRVSPLNQILTSCNNAPHIDADSTDDGQQKRHAKTERRDGPALSSALHDELSALYFDEVKPTVRGVI